MKLRDKGKNRPEGKFKGFGLAGDTLKERSRGTLEHRKRQLRGKLILINSALALVIIMVVLVFRVVALNRRDTVEVSDNVNKQAEAESGKKGSQKKEKATPEPTPIETEEPDGSERWLRKDLDGGKPMVALTFDDGPYAPVTERILAVLKKHDSRATFFCVGNRVPNYTSVVKQAYEQGCQLASHTYEHAILTKLKKKKITWQIEKVNEVMQEAAGCKTTALRPPGGLVSDKVKKTVGVPMVCWNVDSEDWKSRNMKKVLERCTAIGDGDIVLMHDLYPTTADAIEKLVPRLVKKGFQLVTVDELFYYKGIKTKPGEVYFSGK
ncbi:polysaccharide deacetylase [bacterium D16-51]|nr:polysaccharide deacetylase [bacterium D16-59]RKI62671.1 polysaccharide deacetylase [bacterium D16-51]